MTSEPSSLEGALRQFERSLQDYTRLTHQMIEKLRDGEPATEADMREEMNLLISLMSARRVTLRYAAAPEAEEARRP